MLRPLPIAIVQVRAIRGMYEVDGLMKSPD
jgi:hypothetical protein